MDSMERSCVFDIKVGRFTECEQSQISLLTINKTGIVRPTMQHYFIVSICFMYYCGDCLRQTSADILSLVECLIYI